MVFKWLGYNFQQHDFAKWLFKGKSKYITKHLMYGPLRKLVSFVFLLDSRENKTKCSPRDYTLSVYWCCKEKLQVHHFWDDWNKEDPVCYLMNLMSNLENNLSSILGSIFFYFDDDFLPTVRVKRLHLRLFVWESLISFSYFCFH